LPSLPVCHRVATKRRPVVDNRCAVVFPRYVSDKRENPSFAASLPNLFCDGFDLGALARRSRDDMDSSLRKS
jgi:hypothetical protein